MDLWSCWHDGGLCGFNGPKRKTCHVCGRPRFRGKPRGRKGRKGKVRK